MYAHILKFGFVYMKKCLSNLVALADGLYQTNESDNFVPLNKNHYAVKNYYTKLIACSFHFEIAYM